MHYILLAAIVIILFIIFIFEINKKEFYELKRYLQFVISLPGASIFSSILNSLQIACNYKELINYVEATTKKYGNLTRILIGTDVFVVLSKPEDYKLVLTNANGNYKTSVTKTSEIILGDGIIRISGAIHRLRRKMIQPLLNLKYLSEYVTFFDTYSNFCADALEKNIDGPIFDLKPYIARYSFDIFLVSAVGIQDSPYRYKYNELIYWQKKLFSDAYEKIIKPWLRYEWIFSLTENKKQMCIAEKNLLDFIYTILPQKAATVLQDNNKIFQNPKPIFNHYLNRMEELRNNDINKSFEVSDENFLDDFKNFFFAITNTITEMTSFIMLMLAMHTEVQEKLREEISVIFNDNKISSAEQLQSMRYFYMVYQETLRLFPISIFILRQLTGDIKLESCTLPDGCFVMVPIFAIHRNPEYWDKPLEFIPERFSSENSNRHRYTFIPFGTGPRDCLGPRYTFLSVATIVVNLVRRYRFVNLNSNIHDIKLTTDLILRTPEVKLSISRI